MPRPRRGPPAAVHPYRRRVTTADDGDLRDPPARRNPRRHRPRVAAQVKRALLSGSWEFALRYKPLSRFRTTASMVLSSAGNVSRWIPCPACSFQLGHRHRAETVDQGKAVRCTTDDRPTPDARLADHAANE